MEDMAADEVAVIYKEGADAIVMVSRHLSDDVRCAAVNRLLQQVSLIPDEQPVLLRSVS